LEAVFFKLRKIVASLPRSDATRIRPSRRRPATPLCHHSSVALDIAPDQSQKFGARRAKNMYEQRYPEATVGALIFNREGKLFLMRSHKWKDKWVLPGGHVELGERLQDALRREVKEETSLDVEDLEFVCFQEFICDEAFHERGHFIFFDFACKASSSHVTLNAEAQEHVWVTLDEALKMPIDAYTAAAIRKYQMGKRHVGSPT
jgi:nucleoside triphosphatase